MPRGQQKVVIPKEDLPPVSRLSDGSYGYIMRYRIISEDQNRFSHWSPIRELPIPYPLFSEGGISVIGNLVQLVWNPASDASAYDIFMNVGLSMLEKSILDNKATISVVGNHKFSVGSIVEISGLENPPDILDSSFSPTTNSTVSEIKPLENGKVLIGGSFTSVNGFTRNRLALINFDGSIDNGFNVGFDQPVSSIELQQDNKIIVGGSFTTVGGNPFSYMARLFSGGAVDLSFTPNFNAGVSDIKVQEDNKIIVVGSFTSVNSISSNRIVRLNEDGSVDQSFSANSNNSINSVIVQPDGKILISGIFTEINGIAQSKIARLHSDGSLDTNFLPVIDGTPRTIFLQNDNKIIVGGIALLESPSINGLLRLNSDGSLDESFGLSSSNVNGEVFSVTVQSDNKIVIGGFFANVGSDLRWRVAKLNPNGTLDNSFDAELSSANTVFSLSMDRDDNIFIGGQFSSILGENRSNIARLIRDRSPIFYGSHIVTDVSGPNSFSYELLGSDISVNIASGSASGYYYSGSSPTSQHSALIDQNAISVKSLIQIASTNKERSEFLAIFESDPVDLV
jgi:uncharacterized delta-60 repeat protein